MDDLKIELLDCSKEPDIADLDALVGTFNVQHRTTYLRILSKHLDNKFKGYFVVATHHGETVAWTYMFMDEKFAFHGVLDGALGKLYKVFPIKFNTAFISSPVAEYNVVHINDKYKHQEGEILDTVLAELLKILKKQRVSLILMRDHIAPYSSKILDEEFNHLHFMPGSYVDFEGIHEHSDLCGSTCENGCTCFDDYLMRLKKKHRANIRNKMNRRKDDLKIDIVPASTLSAQQKARCHELYVQTRDKQKLKHECLSPGYFHECASELGDCCKMMIASAGDNIIGFAQLLENEDDIVNVRMGMDYKFNQEYNLYHHLLYENIIYCLTLKKKRLYTSQTCYRPKLEVGAKLMPLHTYYRFTNPIWQKSLGRVLARSCKCYSELTETDKPSEVLSKHGICPY